MGPSAVMSGLGLFRDQGAANGGLFACGSLSRATTTSISISTLHEGRLFSGAVYIYRFVGLTLGRGSSCNKWLSLSYHSSSSPRLSLWNSSITLDDK